MLHKLVLGVAAVATLVPQLVVAQPIGTFGWQLQPYCNVVTLNVIQEGNVYRLQGTDDQCGHTDGRIALATGVAQPVPQSAGVQHPRMDRRNEKSGFCKETGAGDPG